MIFPASFDRENLEVVWYSGTVSRSGGVFEAVGVNEIARFFDQALSDPSCPYIDSRLELAEQFLEIVKADFDADRLEVWYNDGGHNATLSLCVFAGKTEQWIELFWSID